ncbi:MAG: 16S rRNA (adenine(1518)-N(6)/adenine(1519)-N(6))-dimethyltransferase RsmA, partial [Deltaproteobacteria bacterium]
IHKIITCADIRCNDSVLEIGPGRGALTEQLAKQAGRLLLVEYDHRLAADLSDCYRNDAQITVIDGDILSVDLESLLTGVPDSWKVVANLPYNISSPVLFRLLDYRKLFSRLVLMLQKEVADRLVASPGCGDYGITTLLLGLWFDMRKEIIVSPGCFHPRPSVDSAVVSFVPLLKPRVEVGCEEIFRRLVKGAFAMRRKTLFNCMKASELAAPEELQFVLDECGIDGKRRGETLSIEEFACLSRRLVCSGRVVYDKGLGTC